MAFFLVTANMSFHEHQGLLTYLERANLLDGFYNLMKKEDASLLVMHALDTLKGVGFTRFLPILKQEKNKGISNNLRSQGNECYQREQFQNALILYNKALLHAPYNSEAMKLAYSNRSALLFSTRAFVACIKDINTCIGMGCSQDIRKKLEIRKENCNKMLWLEGTKNIAIKSDYAKSFFNFNEAKHSLVPSASANLNFVVDTNTKLPDVVASRDIDIGKVVAIETALVTHTDKINRMMSCYYCNKMALNLFPCDSCCHALFCSESCKKTCNEEYHSIECQIIDLLENQYESFQWRLTIKAVIKMKNKSSWTDLISESHNIGEKRMRDSSIKETYDSSNIYSLLSYCDNRAFIYGKLYIFATDCAMLIEVLSKLPSFFPQSHNHCRAAMSAVARIMMHLFVASPTLTEIENSAEDIIDTSLSIYNRCNYGWFALASKLSHSCEPDLLVIGLNNKVALITARPVKKGANLKISYLGHWMERIYKTPQLKQIKLHLLSQIICRCESCQNNLNCSKLKSSNLSTKLRRSYEEWDHQRSIVDISPDKRDKKNFQITCKILPSFQGFGNTNEHFHIFKEFRFIISLCQVAATDNCIIGSQK